jgi:U3 small nucleolar RNA-associated protein 21
MAGLQAQEMAANGPVIKRQKVQADANKSSAPLASQSKIFAPFRVSSTAVRAQL